MKRIFLEEVGSTNDYIKQFLRGGEDTVVCAERQTGGRGTKGRSFLSEKGGVYLSALTFYEALPASSAFTVMTHAAVSVCKTLETFSLVPEIKWSNDVLVGGKKICGILIENELAGNFVHSSVVGIGLNVSNPLDGLENIATSMKEHLALPPAVEEVREELLKNLGSESKFEEYLSYIKFLGKEIEVTEGERRYAAIALAVLPDGRLFIREKGETRALSSAEITIKL